MPPLQGPQPRDRCPQALALSVPTLGLTGRPCWGWVGRSAGGLLLAGSARSGCPGGCVRVCCQLCRPGIRLGATGEIGRAGLPSSGGHAFLEAAHKAASGMGRLSTSWRSSKHASRPGPCPKSSPSAWRSVQLMATLHPGCADWRLPSARRRIWHWSPGLWRPSIGALPSREEAPARRRTCRLEPLCTSGMRPPRRTIGRSRRWRPYRGRCGSGLERPPPSGAVTLTTRRASGSTAPRWESPGGFVDRPQLTQDPRWNSSESTAKPRGSGLKSPFSREGPPSSRTPSAAFSATPSGLMLAGMPSEGGVPRHAGYASPPPSTSSSGGGGLACVPPWVTPWGFEIRRWWAIWCCRMLTRLWVWAHMVRCYLRLCGVWLCTTSQGLRSLQWTRRTRAHRLFLGLLEVLWWRTFGKSMLCLASVPLPLTTPSRAHPRPSQDLHRSHDQLSLPRPAPSPLLLGCPLKSSSCPTLTRMRTLEMDREFVELRSVCRTWGASLLRRMPSGLARPVMGGWGHANDREIRDHGGSSARPPLPPSGSTVCLPRPGWVAPMRLPRPLGRSALYPGGGVARLRSVRPVSGPRLVRVLPPVVGFPPPPVGAGGGGGVGARSS